MTYTCIFTSFNFPFCKKAELIYYQKSPRKTFSAAKLKAIKAALFSVRVPLFRPLGVPLTTVGMENLPLFTRVFKEHPRWVVWDF